MSFRIAPKKSSSFRTDQKKGLSFRTGPRKRFVIPNRAEGAVRNLLFAGATTNQCHSTGQQVPRDAFSVHRNDKILRMGN
jgi:hypothetical protein